MRIRPDALAEALIVARVHCQGELWCIFGCTEIVIESNVR